MWNDNFLPGITYHAFVWFIVIIIKLSSHKKSCWTCATFAVNKISEGAINDENYSLGVTPPRVPKRIQQVLYLYSVCFVSSFIFSIFYLLSLFFLILVPFPPFPFTSFQYSAHYYAANSNDMHDKVDGHPVVDGVRGLQQHKTHAHIVVGPHLQEPVNPVKDVLSTGTQFSTDRGLHGRLSCDAQRDGEEGEVVACM